MTTNLFHILQSGIALGAVSVAIDSQGVYGAVSSLDGSINVWNMEDFSAVGAGIKQNPSETWGLAFIPRGKFYIY